MASFGPRRSLSLRGGSTKLAAFALVWLAPLVAAIASPPEHGEGGGHGAEHASEGISWFGTGTCGGPGSGGEGKTSLIVLLLNFGVLLWVLNKILFKNLRRANAEKSDAIRHELERAQAARAEAEALTAEYEAKLAALETEVEEIREGARAAAEAEHARILADAEVQAEKIKAAALAAGERELARRRTELEHEIVDQAIERAEAAIRTSFGAPDQRRLVDAWIDEVQGTSIGQTGGKAS